METFYPLVVEDIVQETADAVTLGFSVATEAMPHFRFLPGQYITLRLNIGGKTLRRAYSLSSSPLDKKMCITVKRVAVGVASTYLCTEVVKGLTLEALPPMGDFTFHAASSIGKSYYMFAGGSGITPIYANLTTILQTEPHSNVYLFYGNRNEESVIFSKELAILEKQYPNRFFMQYVLEDVKKSGWLDGMLGSKKTSNIQQGIPDARMTSLFLNRFRPQHRKVEYFICGPSVMMAGIETLLLSRGVSAANIRIERFNVDEGKPVSMDSPVIATLTAFLRGEKVVVGMREGQSVLDALIQEGLDPPYSCRTGSCASCIGRCTSGKVRMRANSILEDKEIADGLVLTCQAIPLSDNIEIVY